MPQTIHRIQIKLPRGFSLKILGIGQKEKEPLPAGERNTVEAAAGLQILKPDDPDKPIRLESKGRIRLTRTSETNSDSVRME